MPEMPCLRAYSLDSDHDGQQQQSDALRLSQRAFHRHDDFPQFAATAIHERAASIQPHMHIG